MQTELKNVYFNAESKYVSFEVDEVKVCFDLYENHLNIRVVGIPNNYHLDTDTNYNRCEGGYNFEVNIWDLP